MIRFFLVLLIINCSYSFAESNYRKKIESFAESIISSKYDTSYNINTKQKLQITISPIDKRHDFTPCMTNLTGEVIGDTLKKNTAVKITCADPQPWTTYVRAQVEILIPRVMTSTSLIKGNRLTAENIKLSDVTKYQAKSGSFDELNLLIGTRLKRNLSSGKIITERDVCFVCEDDKVIIKANNKGLLIKTSGIALNDANIGGTVRVKNSRTQRIVVGTVSGLKEVQVSF